MAVSLLFEADVTVCLHTVAILDKQYKPLNDIPDEEGNVKEFPLLGSMYLLVVQLRRIQGSPREDETKQADCQIVLAYRKPPHHINLMVSSFLGTHNRTKLAKFLQYAK